MVSSQSPNIQKIRLQYFWVSNVVLSSGRKLQISHAHAVVCLQSSPSELLPVPDRHPDRHLDMRYHQPSLMSLRLITPFDHKFQHVQHHWATRSDIWKFQQCSWSIRLACSTLKRTMKATCHYFDPCGCIFKCAAQKKIFRHPEWICISFCLEQAQRRQ